MKITQETFENDVENHEMTIELDNGVHRSLYFGAPGTSIQHFRINTWPGHLCFSGDMGTFVFNRTQDMFRFFRGGRINLGYWSEKVQAEDCNSGVMEYSPDTLRKRVEDRIEDDPNKIEIMNDLDMYLSSDYTADEAFRMISEQAGMNDFLTDMSSGCYKEYTTRFRWCCHAIVWSIKQYDSL